jgi:hypothetical protein
MSTTPLNDLAFAAFKAELNLGDRVYPRRESKVILGNVSDRSIDRLIAEGRLQPLALWGHKQSFTGGNLARVLWDARQPPRAEAPPPRKPKSPSQLTPPRRRGRPPKVVRTGT